MRDRASEREKLYIDTHYHNFTTGDMEQAERQLQDALATIGHLQTELAHERIAREEEAQRCAFSQATRGISEREIPISDSSRSPS